VTDSCFLITLKPRRPAQLGQLDLRGGAIMRTNHRMAYSYAYISMHDHCTTAMMETLVCHLVFLIEKVACYEWSQYNLLLIDNVYYDNDIYTN